MILSSSATLPTDREPHRAAGLVPIHAPGGSERLDDAEAPPTQAAAVNRAIPGGTFRATRPGPLATRIGYFDPDRVAIANQDA